MGVMMGSATIIAPLAVWAGYSRVNHQGLGGGPCASVGAQA